ncbi:MAG: AI-2E family transporter [Patescibacteria group bacterium]
MYTNKLGYYFLIFLITAIFGLSAFIFWPFFGACVLAVVFGVIFQPVHNKILQYTKNSRMFSALLTTIIIILVVITPIFFLGMQIFQEAQNLNLSTDSQGGSNIVSTITAFTSKIESTFPFLKNITIDINQYLRGILGSLTQHFGDIFSSFAKLFANIFIFLFTLYYILKDGAEIRKFVVKLSPLPDRDDNIILNKLALAIHSVVIGSLLVAVIQGGVASIGFLIFGLPNVILWGIVATFSALIPGVGTSLVLIPAIAFLFFTGHTVQAIGLFIWAALAVGLIDNFLSPKLLSRGMELHPQIVLISVLGGLMLFGPLGFLIGPLTLNLLFALLDIYSHVTKPTN